VVGQIALSLALIAGAILFLRSLTNLMDIDMGFDKRHVVVASIDPGAAGYKIDDRLDVMMTRIEERIASIPGVHAASFAFFVFNGGSWSTDDIAVPGRQRSNMDGAVVLNLVGPQYLDALKMPILAGRPLSRRDTAATRRVAVINETMARTYFGEPFPLGRTFTVHDDENAETKDLENIEVVGVVRDAKYMTLEERQMPAAFFPHTQHRRNFLFTLVVRHDGAAGAVVTAMREAIANVDPNLPFNDVTTLERLVDDSVVNRRAIAQLSAFFGLLAMVLACIGIYGVTSYGIARRTNEFGIRMALGAGKRHVLWLVLGDTLRTGVLGIAIGLVIAAAGGRSISSLLVGLTPRDPVATGAAVVTMLAVSVLAGYVPACRATRIDPLRALRHD
jgi:predicted permease